MATRFDELEDALNNADTPPLHLLEVLTKYQRFLDTVELEVVRFARRSGSTWEEIGDALGIARQSAWARFKDRDDLLRAPRGGMSIALFRKDTNLPDKPRS